MYEDDTDQVEMDIYTFNGVEDSVDNGEISSGEEGFMLGYMSALEV